MTTDIEQFQFPVTGQSVRTVDIDGTPWFVAADVTTILGYKNGRDAVATLPERMRNTVAISDGTPGNPNRSLVNEAGVYRLVMRSNLPAAAAFQDWLAEEVIPAIRRTGSYAPRHRIPTSFAEALELAARQARELEAAAPMVEQAKQHRAADGMTAVPDFANKVKAWASERGVKVLHKDVWDFLGEIGLLIRGNTIRHNHPTAEAVKRDFVRLKETTYESSTGAKTAASPRLTPAGEGWAWDRAVKRIETTGSLTRKAVSA